MKQELLDDLQRLLKCPIPKVEYAGEAALHAWYWEASELKERIKSGEPIDIQWATRPLNVLMVSGDGTLPDGGQYGCCNFMRYPRRYYDAAIIFRCFVFAIIAYHSNTNPTDSDVDAYKLALREMEEIWVPFKERSNNDLQRGH